MHQVQHPTSLQTVSQNAAHVAAIIGNDVCIKTEHTFDMNGNSDRKQSHNI